MGDIWAAFWLTRFVVSDSYKLSRVHDEHKDRVVENLQDLYAAKSGKTQGRVSEIVRFAHAEQPYLLEEYQRKESKLFRTTGEGRKLIWGYGWGLFVALVKENWLAVTALGVIVGTVTLNVIPWLIKLVSP